MYLIGVPKKKSQTVVERLLDHLRTGKWRPGDRLPSEREFSEEYGVSRTIVREALSALQLAGYLDPRPGDGTYVRAVPTEPSRVGARVQAGLSVIEALEAREALDLSAAHLAIANAGEEDLGRLAQLIGDMGSAIAREDYHGYIALTLDFHNAVAMAGGNRFIQETVAFLIDQVRPSLWVVEQNYNSKVAQDSLNVHRALFEAIKNRDLDAAFQAVRAHYRRYPAIGEWQQP